MNGEAKATREGSFLEAYLTMGKGASFVIWMKLASGGATKESKSFSYGF